VQGAVNHFHKAKTPILFVKLDIAKAFDSVRWEYLLTPKFGKETDLWAQIGEESV
jgi:hypothetical protein